MSLSTVLVGEFGPMTVIVMSRTEIERMSVLQDLAASRIKVTEAATLMSLGRRQVFRLAKTPRRRGRRTICSRSDRWTPGRRVAQCEGFTRRPLEKQVSTPTHRKAAILLPTE